MDFDKLITIVHIRDCFYRLHSTH